MILCPQWGHEVSSIIFEVSLISFLEIKYNFYYSTTNTGLFSRIRTVSYMNPNHVCKLHAKI